MTPAELERWANGQIDAAIKIGVNPLDAQNAVKRFLAKLPPGADPNTYLPRDAGTVQLDVSSQETLADVRGAWYGDEKVPARYKRLLDARAK